MNRCHTFSFAAARALALVAAATSFTALPALAQNPSDLAGLAQLRPFPPQAVRGVLRLEAAPGGGVQARINQTPVTLAPGFRLLSPQNGLVPAHQALDTDFTVNYVLENGTGFLHTAWMLTPQEAALPRTGSSEHVQRNYPSASD